MKAIKLKNRKIVHLVSNRKKHSFEKYAPYCEQRVGYHDQNIEEFDIADLNTIIDNICKHCLMEGVYHGYIGIYEIKGELK